MEIVSGIVSKKAIIGELEMKLPECMTDKTVIKKRLIDLLPTMIQIFDSEPAALKSSKK